MKTISVIVIFASFFYLKGCSDSKNENSNTNANTNPTTTEEVDAVADAPEATDLVSKVAGEACNCLKPLQTLQQDYKNGKIGVAEYSDGMRSITADLGGCVTTMQESLADEGDKLLAQKEVLRKMGELCPDVSGVMFQGN